jgi:catechol 2,3-dioxygenase
MSFDQRFNHVVLFVRDLETMATFYRQTLGFVETDRGWLNGREIVFLSRDPEEHHQLVFVAGLSRAPAEDVINQLSFRLPDLEELLRFARLLRLRDPADFKPIGHGNAWSLYFRDPEGNRIEIYTPSPWYISQPCREPLDIDQPIDAIRQETETWCRSQPGFVPAAVFQESLAKRIRESMGEP